MTPQPANPTEGLRDAIAIKIYGSLSAWSLEAIDEVMPIIEAYVAQACTKARSFNRLEVIDHTEGGAGRDYVKWVQQNFQVTESVQDNGRTLKIFLSALSPSQSGTDQGKEGEV